MPPLGVIALLQAKGITLLSLPMSQPKGQFRMRAWKKHALSSVVDVVVVGAKVSPRPSV
jgi:hypothetical protein